MSKGLAFLQKKGWHTGSFKNIGKVWEAEEKVRKEQEHMYACLIFGLFVFRSTH
jgi:hypothetical protein